MKVNSSNFLSFQKKLVASCNVLNQDGVKLPCKIYQLEDENKGDLQYIKKTRKQENWEKSEYISTFYDEYRSYKKGNNTVNKKFYVMQDKDESCIAFCEVYDFNSLRPDEIALLEVAPKIKHDNQNENPNNFKYVGQTFVAFLVKLCQKSNKRILEVNYADSAYTFYKDKCFFDEDEFNTYISSLRKENFDKLIKKNELNTGSSIDLVG